MRGYCMFEYGIMLANNLNCWLLVLFLHRYSLQVESWAQA